VERLERDAAGNVDITIKGRAHHLRSNRIRRPQANRADKFVDASNLTVIPGMWDPHYHR
jgi:dihydroorotase-like cyclic amidohydrolase